MIKSRLVRIVVLCMLFLSCSKDSNDIDVSKQWWIDANGNLVQGQQDAQWSPVNFTSQELSLFKALDTANLAGTSIPDSVLNNLNIGGGPFPNPFNTQINFYYYFPKGFNGFLVFKYVIVNNHSNILKEGAVRIQSTIYANPTNASNTDFINLKPDLPAGKYRMYASLSTAASPNFFMTWGNIEKTQ